MAALTATTHFAPFLSRRSLYQLWRSPPLPTVLSFAFPRPLASLLGAGLIQTLIDLFPPFLLAAPKKKVSHSRKAMRSANKGLKDKLNIVNCPGCGAAKLAHHLCPRCYSELSRGWKAQRRESEMSGGDGEGLAAA